MKNFNLEKVIDYRIIFLILSLLFVYLLFLPTQVDADCYYPCRDDAACDCGVAFYQGFEIICTGDSLPADHSSCVMGTDLWCGGASFVNSCIGNCADSNRYCLGDACPQCIGPIGCNGKTCTIRKDCWNGISCYAEKKVGTWDESEQKCVRCNGAEETGKYADTSGIYVNCDGTYGSGDNQCEWGCGADSICDEVFASSYLPDVCGESTLEVNRFCNITCSYSDTTHTCNLSHCGESQTCRGATYYCVYDSGWKWEISKPSAFCCTDSDCSSCLGSVTGDGCDGNYVCSASTYRCTSTCNTDGNSCGNCGICSGGDCDEPPGACSPGSNSPDCPCPADGCIDADGDIEVDDWADYPAYGNCEIDCACDTGTGTGQPCEPTISYDDSQCIGIMVTTNDATNVEETTATLNGYLDSDGGEACDVRFNWGDTSSYTNNTSWQAGKTTGAYFSGNLGSLTKGKTYHFRAEAKNSLFPEPAYGLNKTFITKPDVPTSLTATAISSSQIDLSWTKGTGAYYTMIRRKTGSYPTSPSDGVQAYYDTSSSFNDTGLAPSTSYYYRAWSQGFEEGLYSEYSDSYAQDSATTQVGPCISNWTGFIDQYCGPGSCGDKTCIATEMCQKNTDLNDCEPAQYQCVVDSSCQVPSNICPLNTTGNVDIIEDCYIEGEMWLKSGTLTITGATVQFLARSSYSFEETYQINVGAGTYILKSETETEIKKAKPWTGDPLQRAITIDNTQNSSNLTNYPVLVTIDTAFLIAFGKMRSDCGDIRFTDSDGLTYLNYWLESGCNTSETKIWVKIPQIPASSKKTIYMYYGLPVSTTEMTPESNGLLTGVGQLREHWTNTGWGYRPLIIFQVMYDSYLEILSGAGSDSVGRGYAFFTVPKDWINGKYLRWKWRGIGVTGSDTSLWGVSIYDGTYLRMSSSDFVDDMGAPTSKGAGELQRWRKRGGRIWGPETWDEAVNVSSAIYDEVTLFFDLDDGWITNEAHTGNWYWVEVNMEPSGSDNLFRIDFTDDIVMELTGTYGDYGLYRKKIGTDPSTSVGSEEKIPCIRANPIVSLSPDYDVGIAGETITFNVSVENGDNVGCADSTFNLSESCPSGWICSFNKSSLDLPPDAIDSSIVLTVTSSSGASPGNYSIPVTAINTSSSMSGSDSSIYEIIPLYAWWGDGSDGDVVISSDTEIMDTLKQYNNLTINVGAQLYSNQESLAIFVKGNLVLNGTIGINPNVPGGDGGRPGEGVGGKGAATLTIFARNIIGSGLIKANGERGDSGLTEGGLDPAIDGQPGLASAIDGNSGGASSGGAGSLSPAGVAGSMISDLSSIIDQYVNSIHPDDNLPILLEGDGGSGGGGGSGQYDRDSWDRAKGGAGGGGGSMGGLGGNGGKGVSGYEKQGNPQGGTGGGGGGAGGVIVLVSQDLSEDISIRARGGSGGSGGNGEKDGDGGGGGGGAGGIILLIANNNIGSNASGGTGGDGRSAYDGQPGQPGQHFFYDINTSF